jgi:putative SOS response-associated peptidase YedK
MCGRYAITTAPEALRALFGYVEEPDFPPRFNVAPSQPIPVVRLLEGKRSFALLRWGLIPSWVKDPRAFSLLVNARGESVLDKPAFRNGMKRRRCLIPADGFYEWRQDGERKRPFFVRPRDGKPVAFAGLWEAWMGPNGEEMETVCIVTTAANRTLRAIHDRMPVVIAPDAFDMWLDTARVDAEIAAALIMPAPETLFEAYEVSTAVNRTANDSAALIAPVVSSGVPSATGPAPEAASATDAGEGKTPARPVKKKKDNGQASLF